MPMVRIRIRDVANKAGVSPTTASFVLNGKDASISENTRVRVKEAAKLLGYHPHAAARALATGRTHRIGLALNAPESFTDYSSYHIRLMNGILGALPAYDYNLLLQSAHFPDWQSQCGDILSGLVDGIVLIGREAEDPLTEALLEQGFPTVCASYHTDHPACYSVDCDNSAGAYQAVKHLIEQGHRRILHLTGQNGSSWQNERWEGAYRAVAEAGLPRETLHGPLPGKIWHSEEWSEALKAYPIPFSALLCSNERQAQLLASLPELKETALVCFNDCEANRLAIPPISAADQPLEQIGAAAVQMLLELIEGRTPSSRIRRFPMQLNIRASSTR